MRRIQRLKAKEISMTVEGANRRIIAAYKSKHKPDDVPATGAADSQDQPKGDSMELPSNLSAQDVEALKSRIKGTDKDILTALVDVAKGTSSTGKSYTPQAASIIKAVGRMLAPFCEELTLSDLAAVGEAAGLGKTAGAGEEASTFKAKAKPDEAKDDEEEADGQGSTSMDFDKGTAESEDESSSDSDEEDEDEEEEEPIKKSASDKIAPSAKKEDTAEDAEADTPNPPVKKKGEEKASEDDKKTPASAQAWGQPSGTKAKGENVAKSAQSGSTVNGDVSLEDIMKSHRLQVEENKALREAVAKTRKDLDEERNFRALEEIKKSVRETYTHLNVNADELAPVFKSLRDAEDQTAYTKMTELLKAANAQVAGAQKASGIFTVVGKSSASTAGGSSWEDRIEARVDEEVKKSAGRPRAVVYDEFIQTAEGRDMLINHRKETRGF